MSSDKPRVLRERGWCLDTGPEIDRGKGRRSYGLCARPEGHDGPHQSRDGSDNVYYEWYDGAGYTIRDGMVTSHAIAIGVR